MPHPSLGNDTVEKVIATPAVHALVEHLNAKNGNVLLHPSGGGCDNSAANGYLPDEITTGAGDVFPGMR